MWEQGCLPTDHLCTCSLHVFCHLDFFCYLLTRFPFIPRTISSSLICSSLFLCNCLFHLFRVIFLPPGHRYFFQDFLAVPRVEFVPFLPLFPPQMLYCNFLNYISNKWLALPRQCVFSKASNIDDLRRDFSSFLFSATSRRNNSWWGLVI